MLWVDKHGPRRLEELACHRNLKPLLSSLGASDSPPHLLFYGPSGAGKKTLAMALLRELFGDEVDKVRVETFVEKESNAEATVCQSNSHVILSCNEFGFRDRVVIQSIIKSLVEAAPQAALASQFFLKSNKQKRFKVVLLQDADCLTEAAQHALRRSLEMHVASLKFILIATNTERILRPLKSRCLGIRVPRPSTEEIVEVLRGVALKEQTPVELLPDAFLREIALRSRRNLRRGLLSLQCVLTHNYATATASTTASASASQLMQHGHPSSPFPAPWEAVADEIAAKIARSPSVRTLQECRGCFYELLAALTPPDIIISRIIETLFFLKPGAIPPDTSHALSSSTRFDGPRAEEGFAAAAAAAAANYQKHRLRRVLLIEAVADAAIAAQGLCRGSKPIFHLEAFAAAVMRRFKSYAEAGHTLHHNKP